LKQIHVDKEFEENFLDVLLLGIKQNEREDIQQIAVQICSEIPILISQSWKTEVLFNKKVFGSINQNRNFERNFLRIFFIY